MGDLVSNIFVCLLHFYVLVGQKTKDMFQANRKTFKRQNFMNSIQLIKSNTNEVLIMLTFAQLTDSLLSHHESINSLPNIANKSLLILHFRMCHYLQRSVFWKLITRCVSGAPKYAHANFELYNLRWYHRYSFPEPS